MLSSWFASSAATLANCERAWKKWFKVLQAEKFLLRFKSFWNFLFFAAPQLVPWHSSAVRRFFCALYELTVFTWKYCRSTVSSCLSKFVVYFCKLRVRVCLAFANEKLWLVMTHIRHLSLPHKIIIISISFRWGIPKSQQREESEQISQQQQLHTAYKTTQHHHEYSNDFLMEKLMIRANNTHTKSL